MMCYKIPESVCKRLAAIICKFWWLAEAEGKGIHWTNKKHMYMAKEYGGLNFRNLSFFNDALLAKQAWRLLSNQSTMVYKTLKAKYFKETSLLEAHLGGGSSPAWQGVWKAGQKIKEWIEFKGSDNMPVWTLENSGVFTTKSAYQKLMGLEEEAARLIRGEQSDKNKTINFWKTIWKLNVQGKVKIFFWRLFHDFLPSSINLVRRGCRVDTSCKFLRPEFRFSVSEWEGASSWEAPRNPFLKINCDGAWVPGSEEAGFACVGRNKDEVCIAIKAGKLTGVHSIEEVEIRAIVEAMSWADSNGWKHCIFETDCAEAFALISQRKDGLSGVTSWALECSRWLLGKDGWSLSLVRRGANETADRLAIKAREENWSWSSCLALPRIPGIFA
ncbi:hypothetical protein QQ045_022535 [Rhodiola kirilowii]